ncbi:hypothetical protein [Hydrogenimonas sp.]
MKEATTIKEIALRSAEKGAIKVAVVKEPYGAGSEPVVSVGVWLDKANEEPDWKVHIPKSNLDEVIAALQEAKAAL